MNDMRPGGSNRGPTTGRRSLFSAAAAPAVHRCAALARSCASSTVNRPEICPRPPVIGSRCWRRLHRSSRTIASRARRSVSASPKARSTSVEDEVHVVAVDVAATRRYDVPLITARFRPGSGGVGRLRPPRITSTPGPGCPASTLGPSVATRRNSARPCGRSSWRAADPARWQPHDDRRRLAPGSSAPRHRTGRSGCAVPGAPARPHCSDRRARPEMHLQLARFPRPPGPGNECSQAANVVHASAIGERMTIVLVTSPWPRPRASRSAAQLAPDTSPGAPLRRGPPYSGACRRAGPSRGGSGRRRATSWHGHQAGRQRQAGDDHRSQPGVIRWVSLLTTAALLLRVFDADDALHRRAIELHLHPRSDLHGDDLIPTSSRACGCCCQHHRRCVSSSPASAVAPAASSARRMTNT